MDVHRRVLLCLGRISRHLIVLLSRGVPAFLLLALLSWPPTVPAGLVPEHLVSMTKELLLATRDDFKSATGNDEQAHRVQRIYRILKEEGLYNWSKTPIAVEGFVARMTAVFGMNQLGPAEIEKLIKFLEAQTGSRADAAIDELYTSLGRPRLVGDARNVVLDNWNSLWDETWDGVDLVYEINASRGPQTITLFWNRYHARFMIKVLEENAGATREMQTTITGIVHYKFDQQARNLVVSVTPVQMPITSRIAAPDPGMTQPGYEQAVRKNKKRNDAEGLQDDKHKAENIQETKAGPSLERPSGKQEQIEAKRRKIEKIKSKKAHVWENPETGEVVRQQRFRKLKAPFVYQGEGYASDDDINEVARIESELGALIAGDVLGTWRADDGTIWNITSPGDTGKTEKTAQLPEKSVAEIERQIEKIKNDTVFRWLNTVTNEVTTQEKFRRLEEPYKYLGEGLRDPEGSQEIARLEKKLKTIRLPVVEHDPIGMNKNLTSSGAIQLNIQVTRDDDYSWIYDRVMLIDNRITASRTLRSPQDSPHLPEKLMLDAISSFSPPEWVELEAGIDAETGEVELSGQVWRMQVTHSDLKAKSIHSPWSRSLQLISGVEDDVKQEECVTCEWVYTPVESEINLADIVREEKEAAVKSAQEIYENELATVEKENRAARIKELNEVSDLFNKLLLDKEN